MTFTLFSSLKSKVFHSLIDLVLQRVPQLRRSGLNALFLARVHLLFSEHAGDWYYSEIAREAFVEPGVDKESVDAVFGAGNAHRILYMQLGRMDVRERAFYRLPIRFIIEKFTVVITASIRSK